MRILDIAASLFGLIVLSPLLLAAAIAVKLSSRGPALYRAPRVGRGGVTFTMYKFRTMRPEDGGSRITAGDHDPRVTGVGLLLRKYRIDELPQLFNVLRGDMTLVGPRPEDPRFLPFYTPEEWEVLTVRPGLTAPAQLIYRVREREMQPDDDPEAFYLAQILHWRLAEDLAYIRTRTLWGDLRLIMLTVFHLAGMEHASFSVQRTADVYPRH